MLVAFLTSITTLPGGCSICSIRPGESEPVAMLPGAGRLSFWKSIASSSSSARSWSRSRPAAALFMKFDFNPINLRSKNAESIATS